MKVLVAAASKHGSTWGIATAIHEELVMQGLEVELHHLDDLFELSDFDVAIIGSAVYAGRWMKEASQFVQGYSQVLRDKLVWLFSSGPVGDTEQPSVLPDEVETLTGHSGAREHHIFPGKLVKDQLGIGERMIVSAVKAPEGDYRSWKDIGSWAAHIAEELRAG